MDFVASPFTNWMLYSCHSCTNFLVIQHEYRGTDLGYRFLSAKEGALIIKWNTRSSAFDEFNEIIKRIGASLDGLSSTPCKVTLKDGTQLACVEHIIPKDPPFDDRKDHGIAKDRFWHYRYEGIVLFEEIDKLEPSPLAFPLNVRAGYERFKYQVDVERFATMEFVTVEDALGRRISIPTPPSNWCTASDFDINSARCISPKSHSADGMEMSDRAVFLLI